MISSSLSLSGDGKCLVSGGADGTVRLWNMEMGQEVITLRTGAEVHCVAFSPDGQRIVAACRDGTVRIWEAPLAKPEPGTIKK
jgi:WD40 repeat protein